MNLPNTPAEAISADQIAKLLQENPAMLKAFEKKYAEKALGEESENFFEVNSRQMAEKMEGTSGSAEGLDSIVRRIVDEFLAETAVFRYKRNERPIISPPKELPNKDSCVSAEEVKVLPPELRPQCAGRLQKRDIPGDSGAILLEMLSMSADEKRPKEQRRQAYHQFRQGLDILDIDSVLYDMLGMNRASMGHWLPNIIEATELQGVFKIPDTTIIRVPMNLLQLTRLDYMSLTRTTLDIVDEYCRKAFGLKDDGDYFIKTGTYSSKFDFRNCRVHEPKEIRELGEYLLFIHAQANAMAHPTNTPCIYGVSTTNEWAVREFIPDKENNPTIYKGLPLHTEYRVFVDFSNQMPLAIAPYWEPETMKTRFGEKADHEIHSLHDYAIYKAHEDTLMQRYWRGKDLVWKKIKEWLLDVPLEGQWSVDVMQNGDDFWIIDMAPAETSAFYDRVPKALRRPMPENWLPGE